MCLPRLYVPIYPVQRTITACVTVCRGETHSIVVPNVDRNHRSAGKATDDCHREGGIPQKSGYGGYIHEFFHGRPRFCGSYENCAGFATTSEIFAIGGEKKNCNRACVANERRCAFILVSEHQAMWRRRGKVLSWQLSYFTRSERMFTVRKL